MCEALDMYNKVRFICVKIVLISLMLVSSHLFSNLNEPNFQRFSLSVQCAMWSLGRK